MGVPLLLLFRKPDKRRGISTTPVTPPLTFLFDDQFTTADAAPIDIPRNAEPGPGVWNNLIDTSNRLSIGSGVLTSSGGGAATDPNMYSGTTFSRTTGLALKFTVPSVSANTVESVMFRSNAAQASYVSQTGVIPVSATGIRNYATGTGNNALSVATMNGAEVTFYTILRTVGYWGVYRQAGVYRLLFALTLGSETNLPLHLVGQGASSLDNVRVSQLSSPWTNNDNLLSYRSVTPTTNDTQVSEADAHHVVTWTPSAGETLNLIFRRTDDSNYWTARASETGNTLKIIEVVAGGETERATVAATINAGTAYRVNARARGANINVTINSLGVGTNYPSAATNLTTVGTKITIDGTGTLANWEAWKVNLDAASIAELDRMDV